MAKFCQSCGMPLTKDPEGGGTNADGSRSETYCSLCYHDGKFFNPDFTAKEMQVFCVEQMHKQGTPRFLAWLMTRGIPRLERWRNS